MDQAAQKNVLYKSKVDNPALCFTVHLHVDQFLLGSVFLFAEDLYRAKDVASENDDQLPHLSFQFCYFTAEVLVSSLVAQSSPFKEQGWKRGSAT